MHKITYWLLLILLVVLLWLFFTQLNSKTEDSKPNVVSFQPDSIMPETKTTSPLLPNNQTVSVIDASVATSQNENQHKKLTYLEIYRMTRLWAQCENVVYAVQDNPNHDPVARLEQNLRRRTPEQNIYPSNQQIKAITQHTSQCINLLHQVESLDLTEPHIIDDKNKSKYDQLTAKLNDYLLEAKPNTAKELAISKVINLKPIWQQLYQSVLAVSKGDETQNANQIATINQQLKALRARRSEINQLLQTTEDKKELQEEYIQSYLEEQSLKAELSRLRLVDPTIRAQTIAEFNTVNNQIFEFLYAQDADVFYEAQMTLEMVTRINYIGHFPYRNIGKGQLKEPFIEYVSPGDVVLQMSGISDVELFGLVIQPATQLYLCELGADCGPNSQWIKYYCFKNYALLAAESCGMDLLPFYRDYWMSENQWQDVQMVLDIMRSLYQN